MSKADETVEPTKDEQVKTANEIEAAKWEPDFKDEDLVIPYSRDDNTTEEAEDETTEEDKETKNADKPDPVPPPAPTPEPESEDFEPVDDPGDYKPADYSFDIEIAGKSYKVDTAERAAELAEELAEELEPKQLVSLMTKSAQITIKEERDKDDWQKHKDAFDNQSAEIKDAEETINNRVKEITYLVGNGFLPKITDPAVKQRWETDPNAWSDAEFIKSDGVREQVELLQYMIDESKRRTDAGLPPLDSLLDAFNAMENDPKRRKEEEEHKEAGEQRKAAGARVAGTSPAQPAGYYVPKGIAVGDPNALKRGSSIWDD